MFQIRVRLDPFHFGLLDPDPLHEKDPDTDPLKKSTKITRNYNFQKINSLAHINNKHINSKTNYILEHYIVDWTKSVNKFGIFSILGRIWSRIRILYSRKRIRGSGSVSKWNESESKWNESESKWNESETLILSDNPVLQKLVRSNQRHLCSNKPRQLRTLYKMPQLFTLLAHLSNMAEAGIKWTCRA